ncbi:MAG: hypothetical protein AAF170_08520 [Bacteroidota bacterium]
MRVALLVVLLTVLSGCTRTRTVTLTETVEVPIPVAVSCPAPPPLDRPALPIELVAPGASAADVARAYVATVVTLRTYARRLETLLDAYRTPAHSTRHPSP